MEGEHDGYWADSVEMQFAYCGEILEISIELDVFGILVQEYEVCCHSLQVTITATGMVIRR